MTLTKRHSAGAGAVCIGTLVSALAVALATAAAALAQGAGGEPIPPAGSPPPRATFSERIDVARVVFDVRVVDGLGRPIEGLVGSDFEVRLDGEPAAVEAVDWIDEASERDWMRGFASQLSPLDAQRFIAGDLPAPRVVFFFQVGMAPGKAIGHLRLLPRVQELIRELPAETEAAVVAFDSHLKVHQDFTRDRERLAEAAFFGHGYYPAEMPPAPPADLTDRPSLARHLDAGAAQRVGFVEEALALVARAVAAEPGEARIVFVGYGWDRNDEDTYRALFAARTPLFVLDVTDADYHGLEHSLRQVARATGGSYSNTRGFPDREVGRVASLLSGGRYRLTVVRTGLPVRHPKLDVRLRDWSRYRKVLAPAYLALAPAP